MVDVVSDDGQQIPYTPLDFLDAPLRGGAAGPAIMGDTLSVENIVKEVRAEISKLQQVLVLLGETGHGVSVKKKATVEKPKRKVSAAARRKMAVAQKARWAKIRAAKK
jgi:hypothetical protein